MAKVILRKYNILYFPYSLPYIFQVTLKTLKNYSFKTLPCVNYFIGETIVKRIPKKILNVKIKKLWDRSKIFFSKKKLWDVSQKWTFN